MKRLAIFFLTLIAVAVPVIASSSPHPKTYEVNWTRRIVAVPGGFADSSAARAIGTATPTIHDTSSVINLRQFVLPSMGPGNLVTAKDSLTWLRVDFYPNASSPAVTADSIYVTIQVSNDGVAGWTSCTPTWTFDVTTDSALGAIVLEQASTNAFYFTLRQKVGAVATGDIFYPRRSSSTAPTWTELMGWPYMRLVIQSDRTGQYDATVYGYVENE